jgi:hypothetical protein
MTLDRSSAVERVKRHIEEARQQQTDSKGRFKTTGSENEQQKKKSSRKRGKWLTIHHASVL